MVDKKFFSVFTPSQTDPEDLEAIFVQRHELLSDAVERVRESAETDNKHHLLFAGPRGSGKTHFVTLLVTRLGKGGDLEDKLHIAWLNEDETCTTLLELLLKVYQSLTKRYPNSYPNEALDPAFDLEAEAALEFAKKALLDRRNGRTILIVLENLDALFEGFGSQGQKQLRAFIQEHPVFTTVATAQALVDDLTDRTGPFFGFFQTEHMQPLNREEAATLLENIARQNKQADVVKFLQTARGHARVRALHHLSGGNHRIYVVLSQFISFDNIDALVAPFQEMVDKLTPYYQERIRSLPPLQRKIVEYLCKSEGTVPVKELGRHLFATHQTVSNQLKDLRRKGYVKASQRGRESLYEVTEPLMRICVEVKENQDYAPLRLLIDFVRVWYEDQEIGDRLEQHQDMPEARSYLKAALEKNLNEGNLRKRLLVDGIRENVGPTLDAEQVESLCGRLANLPEDLALAFHSFSDGKRDEPLELFSEFISTAKIESKVEALLLRANIFRSDGDVDKEIADYSAVIELHDAPPELVAIALSYRGVTYGEQGDVDKAIADYSAVIELDDAPPEQVAIA
ncbi:MAG: DNA polymerase III delta prime subunit, partial [Verrucomicrobiales bacterium]